MSTKVAAIEMCSSHVVSENLATAGKLIEQAANNQAKLIVLPEMFAIIGKAAGDKVTEGEEYGKGPIQDFLAAQAKQNKVWIIGGTIPILTEDKSRIRAASLMYNAEGEVVARYDKINLFDVTLSKDEFYRESDTTESGDEIVVVETPFGRIGMAVCFDVRFADLFQQMSMLGVDIFVLPSAFTVPTGKAHWEVLTRCRAIESHSYLIAACQGGKHSNGRETYGHSLIVGPWGEVLAEGREVGVIYSEIDLEEVKRCRKNMGFVF